MAVQIGHVAAYLHAVGRRDRRGIDPRAGDRDHPQAGHLSLGRRERRGDPAQQVRAHPGAADRDQADPLVGPVAQLGPQLLAVGRRREAR